jgi:transcriptional regulator with XRE-family HTH domain
MSVEEKFEVPKGFKDLIYNHLNKLGISLRELARRSGISVSYISRILTGERSLPSDEDILNIARALEIQPPEDLLIEARRVPGNKPRMIPLLRAASELSAAEIDQVKKVAQDLAEKRRAKKKRVK